MDKLLDQLAISVTQAGTLEELTRPLLDMLETVTGLESAYLTTVDLTQGVQRVLYSHNASDGMNIGEGLSAPWPETVCKRALDSGVHATNQAGVDFADIAAVKALGIETYLTAPVTTGEDRQLFGTLCAVSASSHALDPHSQRVLALFAKLIGQYVDRERLMHQLVQANAQLARAALTDSLTALPNRRALHEDLTRRLAQGERSHIAVLIAFVDMDGFKAINDMHGHESGDEFLAEVARRLRACLRTGDLAARLGGDEFVVLGAGPHLSSDVAEATRALQERIFQCMVGHYQLAEDVQLDYAGASIGAVAIAPGSADAAQALRVADAAMYTVKQARKASRLSAATTATSAMKTTTPRGS